MKELTDQFKKAMELYSDKSGDNFVANGISEIVVKLNSGEETKSMISHITKALLDGATSQVAGIVSPAIIEFNKAKLSTQQ